MNNGVEVQRLQLEAAVDLAKRLGIPLVATSDAHYIRQEDAVAQDVLLEFYAAAPAYPSP